MFKVINKCTTTTSNDVTVLIYFNFEHVQHSIKHIHVVFLFLVLSKYLPAGI